MRVFNARLRTVEVDLNKLFDGMRGHLRRNASENFGISFGVLASQDIGRQVLDDDARSIRQVIAYRQRNGLPYDDMVSRLAAITSKLSGGE